MEFSFLTLLYVNLWVISSTCLTQTLLAMAFIISICKNLQLNLIDGITQAGLTWEIWVKKKSKGLASNMGWS
uniref:Uncharacterized protein n=1 Tax=Rhizophora mucronata TaxID=61149 RepID=A0A2P2J0H3_RHIMU